MMKLVCLILVSLGCAITMAQSGTWLKDWRSKNPKWFGVHVLMSSEESLKALQSQIPALAKSGVNTLILDIGYSFEFSNPKMRAPGGISKSAARAFAVACRKAGIRPIPQINCLGHQSWAENTAALLTTYPEFDETPGQFPANKGIYCRSWCPQHPEVNKVVFGLIDDLVDAFEADAFHVGMDEVFLIASEHCPRCKGEDPAKLFAKAVNDLHSHIVKQRGLEMFMWGDRLLDGKATGYGEWEAATNGTHPAIDLIPKEIVVCDWHYETRSGYPSVKLFADKGFTVWPSSWKNEEAATNFAKESFESRSPKVVGHLVTTWGAVPVETIADWPALKRPFAVWGR